MPENAGAGGGGAERFTAGVNEQARLYEERITEAAMQFVTHGTRMTISQDRPFVAALASLLGDTTMWLPFESACRRVLGAAARSAESVRLTQDLRTLKDVIEGEWRSRAYQHQQDNVRAATGSTGDRTLPKSMIQRTPQQQLTILVPPSIEQINAIVTRIVESSNAAGIQLLTTRSTLMANTLSSEKVGVALSYRLQGNDENLTTAMMLNECLFSHELGENVNAIMPPVSIVSMVHDILLRQLPVLIAHTAIPWLNDSAIVDTPGYNRTHGIWYQPLNGGFSYPATPTREEMEAAVGRVRNIYTGGFKFASEADRTNVIGSALMNIVQPGISGRSPLCMVTKPVPRTGGTYLATALAMTGQGRMIEVMAWPKNEEERRKSVFAALRVRPSAVVYDNVSGLFEGDTAALMASSPRLSDRVLGVSTQEAFDILSCIFASGNNVEVSQELAERINFINLQAFVDDAEKELFRAGRPREIKRWVEIYHKPAVEALLTMVAWWLSQGAVRGNRVLPGFDEACGIVGGILEACGVTGWLNNRSADEMGRVIDLAVDETATAINMIWNLRGTAVWHAADLLPIWDDLVPLPIETRDNPDAATRTQRLVKWLRKKMDQPFAVDPRRGGGGVMVGPVKLLRVTPDNRGVRWMFEVVRSQTELSL